MSTTRMMMLGLVSWLQPVHGYDVRRELLRWQADKWANIQPGSIYHALRKLTGEGLLAEVGTERVGARPARTRYEITDKGQAEFEGLLRDHWWRVHESNDPFAAAFAFLPVLPPDEAAAALRNRAQQLRAIGGSMRATAAAQHADPAGPPDPTGPLGSARSAGSAEPTGPVRLGPVHLGWLVQLWLARAEGEIAWCERIAAEIDAGVSYDSGEVAPVRPDRSTGEVTDARARSSQREQT